MLFLFIREFCLFDLLRGCLEVKKKKKKKKKRGNLKQISEHFYSEYFYATLKKEKKKD